MATGRGPGFGTLLGVAAVGAALVVSAALLPAASGAPRETGMKAARAATVATLATRDFRVNVAARRLNGGATPTAEVRVALSERAAGRWRTLGERRLDETYFWHTVAGPRAVCRLAVATAGAGLSFRSFVTVQLLLSPSLGCGRTYRVPFAVR